MQYITFYIGEARYGLPILVVKEIVRPMEITTVHDVDPCLEGLINLRGQVVAVVNLGVSIGTVSAEVDHAASWLITIKTERELSDEAVAMGFETSSDTVAFLVDRVGEMVEAETGDVDPSPSNFQGDYIDGVIKLDDELVTVLSAPYFLSDCSSKDNA